VTILLRSLSALCFLSALVALAILLISDISSQLDWTSVHHHAGSLAFILIGASYVILQFHPRRRFKEILKGLPLGVAFLLWGFEQLLPPSRWVTLMDTLVVLVFVTDLGFIILQRLRGRLE
jgi:hypothetical protein